MENYTKGKNVEEELERTKVPFQGLPDDFLWMKVKGGSRMPNLLSYAGALVEDKKAKVVVWTGAGVSIAKTISCTEIFKRSYEIPYQVTKLTYKTDEEYWEPKLDGLETLVVKRHIPVIHIMLSYDEMDKDQIGYQTIEGKKFWQTERAAAAAAASNNNPKPSHGHKQNKKHYKNKKGKR